MNNLVYAKRKSLFEKALSNGLIPNEAIVFIKDTKEIWNNGTYFGDITELKDKFVEIGSADTPVYINSDGDFTEASKYSGGTNITLNGVNKSGSTASFYAPTSYGTSGYLLTSNGSNSTPSWLSPNFIVYRENSPDYVTGNFNIYNGISRYFITENDVVFNISLSNSYLNKEIMFKIVNLSDSNKTLTLNPTDNYPYPIHIINHTELEPNQCYLVSIFNEYAIMMKTGETNNRIINKISVTITKTEDTKYTILANAQYPVSKELYINYTYKDLNGNTRNYTLTIHEGALSTSTVVTALYTPSASLLSNNIDNQYIYIKA